MIDSAINSDDRSLSIGYVLGGGGTLTWASPGKTLFLAQNNTFTGGVTIIKGTVTPTATAGLGTGPVSLGGPGTGAENLQLTFQAGNIANNITVANEGTGTVTLFGNVQFNQQTGTITCNRATTLQIAENGGDWWFGFGAIGGTADMTFRASAAANLTRLILNNASTYTGTSNCAQGRIQAANITAFGNINNTLNITGTGQVVMRDNLSVGALTGGTAAVLAIYADVTSTLTLGNGGGTGTFAGLINNNAAVLSLTKVGTGNQTLTGANTLTGAIIVNGGTLTSSGATALGPTGTVTVNTGATLTFTVNNTATKTVTCNAGGVVNRGGFAHAGITFTGAGTINP